MMLLIYSVFCPLQEPLFSSIPLLVAAGNHEIECDQNDFSVFTAYESYFRNPNRIGPPDIQPVPPITKDDEKNDDDDDDEASNNITGYRSDCTNPSEIILHYLYGNSFYGYIHGMVQIYVLNSYTDTTKGSVQYNWLSDQFENNLNRTLTPWIVIVFHCPLHTTFHGHNSKFFFGLVLFLETLDRNFFFLATS